MQEYITKLEAENKRLEEELGRKQALLSSTPFNSTLYLAFMCDWTFDGYMCGFLSRLSYAYINPYTGREEDKHIKSYIISVGNMNKKDYNVLICNLLKDIDNDLNSFFNTNLQSFKVNIYNRRAPLDGIPWKNIESNDPMSLSLLPENELFELFEKQHTIAMQPFQRITRWTRFTQLIKGI